MAYAASSSSGDGAETGIATLQVRCGPAVEGFLGRPSRSITSAAGGTIRRSRSSAREPGSSRRRETAKPGFWRGTDFDAVVLAMGVDDFDRICGKRFARRDPAGVKMRRHVKTIATQAAQVWMTADLAELGWRRGSVLDVGAWKGRSRRGPT